MNLVALCGMCGSGKTESCKIITEKFPYTSIKLGVTEIALEKFGTVNEEIEKKLRLEIREKHGMGAMAEINLDKIRRFLKNGKNVIIENMYSWSEYKIFKSNFGDRFFTIAIHASPQVRYQRVLERIESRKYSNVEEIKGRDYSEIESLEKGGPISMADFHIINENTSFLDLEKNILQIMSIIEKS